MTKAAALHQFFNQFLPFYPASSVPKDVDFPYGTYEPVTDAWEGGEVGLTVNLWYYTASEKAPNDKAQELSVVIGRSGAIVLCDGGYIRIMRGSPWCQGLKDDADTMIKRRYLNITARFYTEN